jgi:hypothetical protein
VKKLALFASAALLVPAAFLATTTAANAAITTSCDSYDSCTVQEDMGSGYCSAVLWQTTADDYGNAPDGTFAIAVFANYESGYTCDLWIERDVNDTGWYRVGDVTAIPKSGSTVETGHYFNGGGYQARACFQFNWGSSLGAVHCSGAVKYEG